ncbi:MAG: DUF2282 domain-containing protein [Rickettsiaceae bacterium]
MNKNSRIVSALVTAILATSASSSIANADTTKHTMNNNKMQQEHSVSKKDSSKSNPMSHDKSSKHKKDKKSKGSKDKHGKNSMEKCHVVDKNGKGLIKAHHGYCQTKAYSCQGQNPAGDPHAWIMVPKGMCDKINHQIKANNKLNDNIPQNIKNKLDV